MHRFVQLRRISSDLYKVESIFLATGVGDTNGSTEDDVINIQAPNHISNESLLRMMYRRGKWIETRVYPIPKRERDIPAIETEEMVSPKVPVPDPDYKPEWADLPPVERLRAWIASCTKPDISVLIPSQDRLEFLAECLLSLEETSRGYGVEVIIGDSGSNSKTYEFYREIESLSDEEFAGIEAELRGEERRDGAEGLISHNSLFSHPQPKKITLAPEGLYGLAGDAVRTVEPYSEADPVALLVNLMVGFGNVVGRKPHFTVEYSKHHLNFFVALVGQSSKGRKGQSWSTPRYMFQQIDEDWVKRGVTGGLSSGEGVIYAVRDPVTKKEPIKENGRVIEYQEVITDGGVDDKRLLLLEEELSQALKVMGREGNILSPILRQSWDSGNLNPLTKNNPIRATDAHISIVGHITKDELLRHLSDTEKANGFANRFIWLLVRRSKAIPNPKGVPPDELQPIIERLRAAVEFARCVEKMTRDEDAELLWAEIYPELSEGKPGMTGAIIGRAEAQTMRLACLYALLDNSDLVRVEHLQAALALWDFAEHPWRPVTWEELLAACCVF